jgi:N-terminal acetyltransferase B complex catalytic subunit
MFSFLKNTCSALGKAEGDQREWHGHVTAITVAPHFRRLGLATRMMDLIELVSEKVYKGYFVDLYVRCTNEIAIYMYERMGYSVYRRVRDYYNFSSYVESSGQNAADAFGTFSVCSRIQNSEIVADMRKPLPRDMGKRSIRANGRDVVVSAESVS